MSDEVKKEAFVPDEFLCPILQRTLVEAVVADDGHTYEKSFMEAWFNNPGELSKQSPMTRQPLENKKLTPNLTLLSLRDNFPRYQSEIEKPLKEEIEKLQTRVQGLEMFNSALDGEKRTIQKTLKDKSSESDSQKQEISRLTAELKQSKEQEENLKRRDKEHKKSLNALRDESRQKVEMVEQELASKTLENHEQAQEIIRLKSELAKKQQSEMPAVQELKVENASPPPKVNEEENVAQNSNPLPPENLAPSLGQQSAASGESLNESSGKRKKGKKQPKEKEVKESPQENKTPPQKQFQASHYQTAAQGGNTESFLGQHLVVRRENIAKEVRLSEGSASSLSSNLKQSFLMVSLPLLGSWALRQLLYAAFPNQNTNSGNNLPDVNLPPTFPGSYNDSQDTLPNNESLFAGNFSSSYCVEEDLPNTTLYADIFSTAPTAEKTFTEIDIDESEPLKPEKKIADANYQFNMGSAYATGNGMEQDFEQAAQWWEKAADGGNANAQYELANLCLEGSGVEKNLKRAVYLFTKAAEQGHAGAKFHLGYLYDQGLGVEKDLEQTIKWWKEAANQEHVEAQFNLGVSYYAGVRVEKDLKESVKWLKKAAKQQYAKAQVNLGVFYYEGIGVEKNHQKAIELWKKAEKQGHSEAKTLLERYGKKPDTSHLKGKGTVKDPTQTEETADLYREAAEQGNAIAQYKLGYCYAEGKGVTKNPRKAAEWWEKSAKQGHATAQSNLGAYYAAGMGVTQNFKKAVELWKEAAKQKDVVAQFNLGRAYAQGEGVDKDLGQAADWYKKAAEGGYVTAQFNFGTYCAEGKGVEKNYKEAVTWWKAAANQGDINALFNLGKAYYDGLGVVQDPQQAKKWWQDAQKQGSIAAREALERYFPNKEGAWKDSPTKSPDAFFQQASAKSGRKNAAANTVFSK